MKMDATETQQPLEGDLPQNDTATDMLAYINELQEEVNSEEQGNLTSEAQATPLRRFVDKVMIVVAGQSGVGKSSIINVCFAGIKSEQSADVVEYGKKLCVTAQLPNVTGKLSFVELSNNLAAATQFRAERFDSKEVYPNMIIFTTSACDNRMVGPDSGLHKNLMFLRDTMLIDNHHTNLIVAVTHAMSIPLKLYTSRTKDIIDNISQAVYEVLQIRDVKIVFVENEPEDYEMQKGEESEFYKLPNGEMSHQNLILAMRKQMEINNDSMGKLLCDWYFGEKTCAEKDMEASLLCKIDLRREKEKNRSTNFSDESTKQKEPKLDVIPEFTFQYIGRGYCPRTENLKNVSVFSLSDLKPVDLLGKQYAIPSCVTVTTSKEKGVKFYKLTSTTKKQYEKHKIAAYGLESETRLLSVSVNSFGRWVKDELKRQSNAEVVFVYERRLVEITLDKPILRGYGKQELFRELKQLPETYEQDNHYIFNEFFSKWGTHFVSEDWLGGYIEVEQQVDSSQYNEQRSNEIYEALKPCFLTSDRQGYTSSSLFIENEETVRTYGGDPSTHMNTLQNITSTRLSEWEESLTTHPTELKHCFKLQPYYNIVESNYQSLQIATEEYLSGAIFKKTNLNKRSHYCEEKDYLLHRENKHVTLENSYGKCVPMSAIIYTKEGPVKCCNLVPGCEVQTLSHTSSLDKNQVKYTEFCNYLHFDPNVKAEFLILSLDNGHALKISKNHQMFAFRSGSNLTIAPQKMKVGDEVIFVDDDKKINLVKVTDISTTEYTGICCPLTCNGTLIVDGVLISCYASVESFFIAHTSLLPLRVWYNVKKALSCLVSNSIGMLVPRLNYSSAAARSHYRPNIGIHLYARILIFLRRLLWFKV